MRILQVLLCIGITQICFSQRNGIDTTKYKIVLPDYWKKGDKVWFILSEALPRVCPEIKDKELCLDPCRAMYTVELFLTEAKITNTTLSKKPGNDDLYDVRTFYQFSASLYLKDTSGKILVDMLLVDTNESYSVVSTTNIPPAGKKTASYRDGNNPANMKPGQERVDQTIYPHSNNAHQGQEFYNRKPEKERTINQIELYRIIHGKFLALKE